MLHYKNIITSADKEVRDPVSGFAYPMSVNDMHAQRANVELNEREDKFASMLASILK